MKKLGRTKLPPGKARTGKFQVACTEDELHAMREVADREYLTLSSWARRTLMLAVENAEANK